MKNLIILIPLLFGFVSYGQVDKGNLQFGGSLGGGFGSQSFLFNFEPQAGFFISDNLLLGIEGYGKTTRTKPYYKIYSFQAGPIVKYYINLSNQFKILGFGKPYYSYRKSRIQSFDLLGLPLSEPIKESSHKLGFSYGVGIAWFPMKYIGIEARITHDMADFNFNRDKVYYKTSIIFNLPTHK